MTHGKQPEIGTHLTDELDPLVAQKNRAYADTESDAEFVALQEMAKLDMDTSDAEFQALRARLDHRGESLGPESWLLVGWGCPSNKMLKRALAQIQRVWPDAIAGQNPLGEWLVFSNKDGLIARNENCVKAFKIAAQQAGRVTKARERGDMI